MNINLRSRDPAGLRQFLLSHLLKDILPFWHKYAVDEAGGLNTCISDDGTVVNRDKWLWSQWRAVWVWSKLYNSIDPRSEWLRLATHIYQFAAAHGWDEKAEGWRLSVDGDGKPLRGCESIYVDGFAIYGLTEYAKATGDEDAVALARKTADSVLERLQAPHDTIPHFPYPVPRGARVHGLPMIFSLVFWELGRFLEEERYTDAALAMSEDIFTNFHRPDRDLVVERIADDNSEYPSPLGTAVIPGHVIEDMWFQIHIARDNSDRKRISEACRLMLRHAELGWDDEYGGLLLAFDADGAETVGWDYADTKIWWPHTEALYGMLLGYEHTKDDRFLEWYWRVHDYSFAHFPVEAHGEWTQKLNRRGKVITDVVALPVKDPFHLPRALIYSIEVLERLTREA